MSEIWESQEPTVSQILEGPITAEELSRAIVTTLNEPYEEANRRAWANITRPVES